MPCRLADTRSPQGFTGFFGPPALAAFTPRVFPVAGYCGIPNTAQAVVITVTVTNTTGQGWISLWPGGDPVPAQPTSRLNYAAGQTIANTTVEPLGARGDLTLYSTVGTDLVLDVSGYFDEGAAGPIGPEGPTGPQGAQGPAGTGAFRVVDSLDQYVGSYMLNPVTDPPYIPTDTVGLLRGGIIYRILVDGDGFKTDDPSIAFYYVSTDCSGQAYRIGKSVDGKELQTRQSRVVSGAVCFIGRPWEGSPRPDFLSKEQRTNPLQPATCQPTGGWTTYAAGRTVGCEDISHFVPPFRIVE